MHVSKLDLRGVRQFDRFSIEFKPGFNLLAGENGAGKSTILRSLNAVLSRTDRSVRQPIVVDEDIQLHSSGLTIEAIIGDARGNSRGSRVVQKQWGQRAKRGDHGASPPVFFYGSNEATCSSFVGQRIRQVGRTAETEMLRGEEWLFDAEKREQDGFEHSSRQRFGRSRVIRSFILNILSTFSEKFTNFAWRFLPYQCVIRAENGPRLVGKYSEQAPSRLSASIMRHIQKAGSRILWPDQPSVLINSEGYQIGAEKASKPMIPSFRELLESSTVDPTTLKRLKSFVVEVRLTPRILIRSREGSFFLSQLSDGEKRLFSIFADIARRLSLEGDLSHFNMRPAVVLIDEIDVHLHPKWQRKIVPALAELFPTCQFIATTHSPFVIQATAPGKLKVIGGKKPGDHDYSGRPIEDIVEYVQGIEMPQRSKRAEDMSQAAEKYFRLLRRAGKTSSTELKDAELAYRKASEPFTSEPGLNALLKVEAMMAK
jgi:energy-coupling factor transporter ATP-binding protein EcfA2